MEDNPQRLPNKTTAEMLLWNRAEHFNTLLKSALEG